MSGVTSKPKTAFWWINYLTKQQKHEELQLPAKTLMLNQILWYLLAPQGAIPYSSWAGVIPLKLTTVESNQHSTVSFFNLHPAVWAGVIPLKLTTVESNQHPTMSFFNLHPPVSNLPHVYTSCRVKLTLERVRWILFDTIVAQYQHLWVWPSFEVASVLNLTPLVLSLNHHSFVVLEYSVI